VAAQAGRLDDAQVAAVGFDDVPARALAFAGAEGKAFAARRPGHM